MRLVHTATARAHIFSAVDWYNNQAPKLGARFLVALEDLEQLISSFPAISPQHDARVRRALVPDFPYSVYYHVLEETVVVVAVIHTSQHPETWKK